MLAWISVHDHVVGGKLRGLAKDIGCSQKEALGILVSLWLWGLNNADRTGALKSCDRDDVADELSKGLSEGLNPTSIVESLVEQNWIDEESGILYLHDWDSWQEQWYKFLSTKEYDAKRKREARAKKKIEESAEDIQAGKPQDEKPNGEIEKAGEVPVDSPADSPADYPEDKESQKPEKPKKAQTRKKPEKKQYAEYVALSEVEYEKLVSGYGQAAANKFVEELNLYKGSSGRTYKSDYMTILNWVVEKVEKKYPGILRRPAPTQKNTEAEAEAKSGNPYEQWKE